MKGLQISLCLHRIYILPAVKMNGGLQITILLLHHICVLLIVKVSFFYEIDIKVKLRHFDPSQN